MIFFQSISDREGTEDLSEEANPDSDDPEPETEPESTESDSAAKMDLDAFLSQFVLIKTPYGYILARAPQQVTIFWAFEPQLNISTKIMTFLSF